MIKNQ